MRVSGNWLIILIYFVILTTKKSMLMKRYFLFVCIISLLTVSCNKDNDPGKKWVGTYHYIVNVSAWAGP